MKKKIVNLKLTQLSKSELLSKHLNAVKGGVCPCVCVGCLCMGGTDAMEHDDAPYGITMAQLNGIESRNG